MGDNSDDADSSDDIRVGFKFFIWGCVADDSYEIVGGCVGIFGYYGSDRFVLFYIGVFGGCGYIFYRAFLFEFHTVESI